MGSNQVKGAATNNSHLGSDNRDDNVVNDDKKNTGLSIDSNAVDKKNNELNLKDSIPEEVDGEGLGVHNSVGGLYDCDKNKNELNSVMNEVGCVKDSPGDSLDDEIKDCADAGLNSVVITRGQSKRLESESRKERKSATIVEVKVDANADPDIDTIVPEKRRGRPSKERNKESDAEKKVKVGAGDYAIGKNNGKAKSICKKKVDANADLDIDTIVPERRRGRSSKTRNDESDVEKKVNVSAGGNAIGKNDGKANNTCEKKVGVNDIADLEVAGPKKKRSLLPKKSRVEGTVEEKVRDHSSDEKAGDEETVEDTLATSLERETRGRRNGLDDSERMKRGEERAVNADGDKCREREAEKGRRGRKRKMMETSVQKSDGGKRVKKAKETSFDDESEGVARGKITRKNNEEKEEGRGRCTQKQLITDSIKCMLIKAGWTIERRPRNNKENCYDSVYVCPKGKGYWSVTLAYKILEQEVENGKADSKAVQAFVPIAEDEFNSLLRKNNKKMGLENNSKKCNEDKDQSSEEISRKKYLEKKDDKEKDRLSLKHKEKFKKPYGKGRKNKKRLALLSRGSKKGSGSDGENFSPNEKRLSLLSWMIDLGTVPLGVRVKITSGTRSRTSLEGKVTKDGIHCDCCNRVFALADFEFHSGNSLNQPLQNIFLDSETSILQCLRDSWIKYGKSMKLGFHNVDIESDPNDDICNMCGDGGDLICCDSCPSAIHQNCLNIQDFPSGDWNCVYCSCKYCGLVGESTLEDMSNPALPTCRLCERNYHVLCIQGKKTPHNESNSSTFCSQKCQEIFHQLEGLMGVKHKIEGGYSWTLIKHSEDNLDISSLSGANKIECNAKLAAAWSIMDECFLPIIDPRSGINMLHNVVFSCGSNFRRLNYTGFFVAILERGDEIISAATLRIHGNRLAEMPFIGTRHMYRRQGMCRRLLNAIESALSSLHVEKLILPAISEVQHTWTSVFGFMPLEESDKKELKCMNVIAFEGVDMLQKPVENL